MLIGASHSKSSTKILKPFENDNLYICGSNYSQRQAWAEGALETSEEVIKLIHGIKENKKNKGLHP